jgi:hypothetical protein
MRLADPTNAKRSGVEMASGRGCLSLELNQPPRTNAAAGADGSFNAALTSCMAWVNLGVIFPVLYPVATTSVASCCAA